jgi:hypothetical protein
LVIAPASVEGQFQPTATVTLTAAAPTGGARVALESGNTDAAKVPASVTVPEGSTTATFLVDTSTVPAPRDVTIEASYLGVTRTFVLTVRAPPLSAAQFSVSSSSRGSNACEIVNASGAVDCRLDASATSGAVARYTWILRVGSRDTSFSTGDNLFVPPTNCSSLAGGTSEGGTVGLNITLVVEDRSGNKSTSNNQGVTLFTRGFCGY